MAELVFEKLEALALMPEAQDQTIQYVSGQLAQFLKRQDRVLICFPMSKPGSIGHIMQMAVGQCGATPLAWGPDYRWKALLRQAFSSRATAIIGPPLIVLGLTKLAKATGTPLYIRNVVTAGYPCLDWMIDGIQKGLDCKTWGCYDPGTEAVVAGFSCGRSRGVHLRTDAYSVEVLDEDGNPAAPGAMGEVVICPTNDPALRYYTLERARIERNPCPCGCNLPRLMDMEAGANLDPELSDLGEYLHTWTSILDCKVYKGNYGLELELITFPGEKLPKLPSCAKRVVRPWDPERDMPFWTLPGWKNPRFSGEKD